MLRIRRVRGLVRPCRGLSDIRKPRLCAGAFSYRFGSEWADSAAEFFGEAWFGVACEEIFVDYFTEFGEPVA